MRLIGVAMAVVMMWGTAPARAAEEGARHLLYCYGIAYAGVEMIAAARGNLQMVVDNVKKDDGDDDELRGITLVGVKTIQAQALRLLRELGNCLRDAEPLVQRSDMAAAFVSDLADELDDAVDEIDAYDRLFADNKFAIETAMLMAEDMALFPLEEFPREVRTLLDGIEPAFLSVSRRSR